MNRMFDAFLSHNSLDKPIVEKIGGLLKQRGLKVWLDKWELVPGRPWQEALEEIISSTKSAVVFTGSGGIGPWQNPEMPAALSQFVKKGLPVIPVILPTAPSEVHLPLFLENLTWVDFRSGLSEENMDRLVWGITGSKPDNDLQENLHSDPKKHSDYNRLKSISSRYFYNEIKCIAFDSGGLCKTSKEIQRIVNSIADRCKIAWGSRGYILDKTYTDTRLKRPFIGEACVTNREFWAYIKDSGNTKLPNHWMRSLVSTHGYPFPPEMETLPVVNISFSEAKAFARYIGARLPFAEERTIAVSGSSGCLYPWGENYIPRFCNGKEGGENQVVSVESFSQGNTAGGIKQLAGNVSEWVTLPDGTSAIGGGSYLDLCEYWGIGYVYKKMGGHERRGDIGFRIAYFDE